ncbi:hypothetical protein ARALYDRAFT_897331 [Arabidopsis lyrata subsp. lyrata]|uniref:Uncharacterized protein n=1 Tax=Arabidopsis lyrata subsp. lyrata TaxID=81972 RepID=D7L9W3_ARALL|nr:hypothetical protein ARALYDRAFT_897331 [Arabidopsis lyrata subsp. lyrata]
MKGALFVTVLSALILSDGYVTLLDYLPIKSKCSSGYDVAMHVQRILADTLGFECTDFTRKVVN